MAADLCRSSREANAWSRVELDASENVTNEVANFLIVTPRLPLTLGRDWRLVLNPGLPSAEQGLRLRQRREVMIGSITPFTCLEVSAQNLIFAGPTIELRFSKAVAESLTNQPTEWIELIPAPSHLTVQVQGSCLVLRGDFKSDSDYTLILRAGLPSAGSFSLATAATFLVHLSKVPPRLFFPAFSNDQMAGGVRTFPLLLVNVPRVRLRAKLIEPTTSIHALRGFAGYYRSWRDRHGTDSWDEPYRALNYALVAGRTVFEQDLDGTTGLDLPRTLDLSWDELLPGRKSGVVFLEAERLGHDSDSAPVLGTQALIQLTDLGLVWKQSRTGLDVFVFSHATGRPVGGADVRLLGKEGERFQEQRADTNGLAHLSIHTNGVWLTAEHGDDFHAMELTEHPVRLYGYDLPYTTPDAPFESRKVMLFSDRTLYRPGEMLHLKALVRDWGDKGLEVPSDVMGTLVCSDARGREWLRTNVVFSATGSWSLSQPLPAGPCGDYLAKVQIGDQEFYHLFAVEEFQASAFELTLSHKAAFGPGERVQVPVSARYYFGKPLSRAQVKWSLEALDIGFSPGGFESFTFKRQSPLPEQGRGSTMLTLAGEGTLTAGSNFLIAPELPVNPAAPQPRSVSLLAEVTDLNQQTLTRRVEFLRHSSDFYLGLRTGTETLEAGTELPVEAVAVRADGQLWPEPVKVRLKLQRVEWQSVRLQGAGRSVRFRNEAVVTLVAEKEVELEPAVSRQGKGQPAQGRPLSGLIPDTAGQYWLELSAEDPGGREVASAIQFSVSAPGEASWSYRNETQITLQPDQPLYQPGQTASILVQTPINGTALVTIERERMHRSFLVPLAGNAPTIRVPLEPGDVPNVFVSVTLVRGADDCPREIKEPDYRVGYCQLAVQDPNDRLGVGITASATNCLPGQPVEVSVLVQDLQGQAVPQAEVTLYAVDEGILSLTAESIPDPYAFFYAPRPLSIQTHLSLPNLLSEDREDLRFENKGYSGGGGGRESVRRNFLACAFWSAQLTTDAAGQVAARFNAPDSLTRYRLMAVVHSGRRFGSGQSAFEVSKPLVIEPALPAFANLSDRLLARALVQNQTEQAGETIVTLELDDKAKLDREGDQLTKRLTVSAHGSALVEFPLQFTEPGSARWIWRVRFAEPAAAEFTDTVQSTLSVGYVAPLLREILLARLPQGETNLLARANPQLLDGQGNIQVTVANTRLSELAETVNQLLHYPYGCAEQTGSSLLPWILLRDSSSLSPLLRRATNQVDAVIRQGIDRLFSMQTSSGGLAYWPGQREPMSWASAYGALVLASAQRHGNALPEVEWGTAALLPEPAAPFSRSGALAPSQP